MSVAQILPDDVIVFAPLKTRHKESNFSKRFARLAAAESLSENSLQIKSDKKKISKTRSQNSLSSTKDQVVITNGVIPSGFTPKEYRVSLGTLTALINHLTSDCDVDFRTTFLMTYRKFTTAEFLMTALRNRFNSENSESGSEITKVHLRVLGTLKAWIENHWRNDFQLNDSLQVLLQEFVNDLNGPIWGARAKQLQNIIQRKIDPKPRHFAVDNPPDIISPRCDLQSNLKFISLGCLSPIEVARQLAIYSFRIYEQIQAPELLDLAWTKEDKQDLAPNVVEIIKFSDKLSKFSMQNIVMHKSVSDRTTALGWFIVLTEELFKLNDINSSYAVYQALQSAPVMQLQRSWKELGDAHTTRWKQLVHTLQPDKNFKNLRHHVLQCSPPMLPLMELYLKDLTEIEGENITRFENGLINVEKCTKVSNVIQYLQQYQEIGYSLYYQEILVFKKWIDSWKFVEEATLVRRANIVEPETVDWNTYDTMLDFYFQVDTSLDHPPESIPSEESGHSSPKPKLSRKKVLKIKKKKSQSNK